MFTPAFTGDVTLGRLTLNQISIEPGNHPADSIDSLVLIHQLALKQCNYASLPPVRFHEFEDHRFTGYVSAKLMQPNTDSKLSLSPTPQSGKHLISHLHAIRHHLLSKAPLWPHGVKHGEETP